MSLSSIVTLDPGGREGGASCLGEGREARVHVGRRDFQSGAEKLQGRGALIDGTCIHAVHSISKAGGGGRNTI